MQKLIKANHHKEIMDGAFLVEMRTELAREKINHHVETSIDKRKFESKLHC